MKWLLTLQAVRVEQVLALFVALDAALGAPHPLPSDAPEETLALVAVGRRRRCPGDELVRRGRGDRVDHCLQRFLVHVHLLRVFQRCTELLEQENREVRVDGTGERAWEAHGRTISTTSARCLLLERLILERTSTSDSREKQETSLDSPPSINSLKLRFHFD